MAEPTIFYEGPTVTRAEARALGVNRFFTGIPCKHGHIAQRMVANKFCAQCDALYRERYREDNRERIRARDRALKKTPHGRKNHALNERARRRRIDAKRALSVGRPKPQTCELCSGHGGKIGIVFDHCHVSGQFRGWLCGTCNKALGLVKDSPDLLRKMADYLERSRKG